MFEYLSMGAQIAEWGVYGAGALYALSRVRRSRKPLDWSSMVRHTRIQGQPGSGKTTLMAKMGAEWHLKGVSVIGIDPHGSMARILESKGIRRIDVSKSSPSLNPLFLPSKGEALMESTVEEFSELLEEISASPLGSIQESLLRRDLWRVLRDEPLPSPSSLLLSSSDEGVAARISKLLSSPSIRRMVEQSSPFESLSSSRVYDLGSLPRRSSDLIYRLLLIKIRQLAFSNSRPVLLLLDEIQRARQSHDLLASMLEELRKFSIGVILAYHNLDQLGDRARAISDLVETSLFFRISRRDARALGLPERVSSLPRHKFIRA